MFDLGLHQKIASGKMPLSWEICLIGNYSREAQLDDDFLFHDDLAVTTNTQWGVLKFKTLLLFVCLYVGSRVQAPRSFCYAKREIWLIGNYSRETQLDDDFLFHDDLAVHCGGFSKYHFPISIFLFSVLVFV